MANFLIESEPAAAQSMAEADAIASATRRKNAAYNALAATYGPAAGDPEAQAQLQSNALNQQLDPLKVQQEQLDTTQKQQAYDKAQALQAVSTIKTLMDGGMSGVDALAVVRQHAPELGLDDQHVADLAPLLDQNHDNVLGHFYDALTNSAGSKPTGQQVMLQDPVTKQVRIGYLGADGKMHVPTVPGGLSVLPKVTGAGVLSDNGDSTYSITKIDAAGNPVTATVQGKPVTAELGEQRIALERARVRIAAQREARIAQTGSQAFTPASVDMLAEAGLAHGISLNGMGIRAGTPLAAAVTARMAQRLADSGDSVQATIYQGQALKERQTAVNDLGKATPNSTGGKVSSANALIAHTDQLAQLGDALSSGNLPLINAAQQAYAKQTGSAAPTNFNAVKKIAADEAVKFIVANGGGVADRKQAEQMFAAAQSPAQLKGAIKQVQDLAAGQLAGQRQRYSAIGATNEFDATLSPRTKQVLGVGQAAPAGGGNPTIIRYDAQGNRVQ